MCKLAILFTSVLLNSHFVDEQQVPVSQFLVGGNVVQDPIAPVSFQLAQGWTLTSALRWRNHETTLTLIEERTHQIVSLYYQYPLQSHYSLDPTSALREGMNDKVSERQGEGFKDYRIRAGSVESKLVGGRPALSFIADFTGPKGEPRLEYMVRILSPATKAHFFLMAAANDETNNLIERLQTIISTLTIS